MSTHKHIDKICAAILLLTLIITVVFSSGEALGIKMIERECEYEKLLFDTSKVHTIDIIMDDWDSFIEGCQDEEYTLCTVVIDNEKYKNTAIRAKGNTSLTQVAAYGNDRYSFKLEFDHYDSTASYHGLDKICLNNIISDNTYMKDYLCYQMMSYFDVPSPLCSYAYITVNGSDFGLYLAVEAVEEAFLERNFGADYGELYKPDSQSMGGGKGNGKDFDAGEMSDALNKPDMPNFGKTTEIGNTSGKNGLNGFGGIGGTFGTQSDVLLKYTDDSYDSYTNIFDNAKTDITDDDKDRLIAALKRLSSGEDIENTVSVESVIRYFVVHNFVLNFDSYTGSMIHNYYLYEKDGQLLMIPWDYNLAFGGFGGASNATTLVNYPIDQPTSGDSVEARPMLAWIFASEEYTELYHRYFTEFTEKYFSSGYFENMIDEVSSLIAPYVSKDPTKFCTYEEFEKGVTTLKSFCILRAESISAQLSGNIGSTSNTQTDDQLIDASDISISDMGTMNMSGSGGGMPNGDLPSGDIPSGDIPSGDLPSGGMPNGDMPSGDMPSGDMPSGGMPNGDMPSGDLPSGGMPNGDMPSGDLPSGGMPNGDMPSGDLPSGGMPNGDMPSGDIPSGDLPSGGMPNGDMPSGGNSVGSSPINSSAILLIVSIAVLAFGLIFARLWKNRKF